MRAVCGAAAAGAYLLCLPWDLRNRPESPGSITETTPVTATGVAVLGAVLVLLAGCLGSRDAWWWPVLTVGAVPSALLYASLSTHPDKDASVWPLAWAAFTALILCGVAGAAWAGRRLRSGRRGGRSGGGPGTS